MTGALHVLQLHLSPAPPIILSSHKILNGDILVPDNRVPPGKMAVKKERACFF